MRTSSFSSYVGKFPLMPLATTIEQRSSIARVLRELAVIASDLYLRNPIQFEPHKCDAD
jgi:hypothetical protein